MLKPCSRILYLVVLLALLAFGFAGCGGDGGLGGGIGGGAGNTPVISGTIDALSSSGRIVDVGSTDATGVVSITASKLSGVTYPLVLELYGGTGFAGTMYSVMETSGTSSVYFSAFSTMWIKRAKAAAGSFEDITQAHLDAAKAEVQSVYALLTNNAAATDFTTINPLANAEMAMVHQVFDADSGAGNQDTGYSGFDAAIDSMVTGLATDPLTAITSTFQTATSAAALQTLIQEVSSSSTAQATIAAAYPQLSTAAISSAASTLNTDASGASVATSLLGKITVTSTVDDAGGAVPFSATPADNLILFPSLAATRTADDSTFYTTTYSVLFADGTAADNTVTVRASTTSGTVSIDGGAEGASATGDCTGGNVAVKIIAPTTDVTPGNATFTLTFTTASGSTATVQNTISFFDETVLNPSDVSCDVTSSAAPSKLLELSATALATGYNTTATFAVSADIDGVGTGSFAANTYKINFYPPAGTKFFDGTSTYDNYLVPVGAVATGSTISLGGADGLGSDPMIYVPTAKRSIGSSGTFRAVVTDWTGAPLSPSIYGASADSYYQVDDADRLKEIQLTIDTDPTAGLQSYGTLRTQTGLVDQATVNMDGFQATLVTWHSSSIGGGAYSNSWIASKTTDSFALKVDRGNQGFVADAAASGNYDVTTFINTAGATQTITDGVGAIDLDYIAQMKSGDDNKDVITLVWKYIDGSTVKTMTSTPVTFQGKQ
jgi:hypothetical protein